MLGELVGCPAERKTSIHLLYTVDLARGGGSGVWMELSPASNRQYDCGILPVRRNGNRQYPMLFAK